jgi:hypothetical protein
LFRSSVDCRFPTKSLSISSLLEQVGSHSIFVSGNVLLKILNSDSHPSKSFREPATTNLTIFIFDTNEVHENVLQVRGFRYIVLNSYCAATKVIRGEGKPSVRERERVRE